jgi:hypothetical protein
MAFVAPPANAQSTYALAVGEMQRLADPSLDQETNVRIAQCYVEEMSEQQRQIVAAGPADDALYEVLLALPMSATDCENAVVSEATGIEWTRP